MGKDYEDNYKRDYEGNYKRDYEVYHNDDYSNNYNENKSYESEHTSSEYIATTNQALVESDESPNVENENYGNQNFEEEYDERPNFGSEYDESSNIEEENKYGDFAKYRTEEFRKEAKDLEKKAKKRKKASNNTINKNSSNDEGETFNISDYVSQEDFVRQFMSCFPTVIPQDEAD